MTTSGSAKSAPRVRGSLERQLVVRLAQLLSRHAAQMSELTKQYGISLAQHNVLAILRGAGGDGLPSGVVAERLINKEPDITRLLDRMENQNLIVRSRDQADRRVVMARLTEHGLSVLTALDEPLKALHHKQFKQLSTEKLEVLVSLLKEAQECSG